MVKSNHVLPFAICNYKALIWKNPKERRGEYKAKQMHIKGNKSGGKLYQSICQPTHIELFITTSLLIVYNRGEVEVLTLSWETSSFNMVFIYNVFSSGVFVTWRIISKQSLLRQ
jgi:hypothetical protein